MVSFCSIGFTLNHNIIELINTLGFAIITIFERNKSGRLGKIGSRNLPLWGFYVLFSPWGFGRLSTCRPCRPCRGWRASGVRVP